MQWGIILTCFSHTPENFLSFSQISSTQLKIKNNVVNHLTFHRKAIWLYLRCKFMLIVQVYLLLYSKYVDCYYIYLKFQRWLSTRMIHSALIQSTGNLSVPWGVTLRIFELSLGGMTFLSCGVSAEIDFHRDESTLSETIFVTNCSCRNLFGL
jgi:hypothetical protein